MSLVVSTTGGATYERVDPATVDKLIIDFDENPDPELNPEIVDLIKPSLDRGYRPEDRNTLLKSVKIEAKKKPLKARKKLDDDSGLVVSKSPPIDIPGSMKRRIRQEHKIPHYLQVDLEAEKEKEELRESREKEHIKDSEKYDNEGEPYDNEDSLVVDKEGGGPAPLQHDDDELAGSFDGGDELLFTMEPFVSGGYDNGFEGGEITDYFEVQ